MFPKLMTREQGKPAFSNFQSAPSFTKTEDFRLAWTPLMGAPVPMILPAFPLSTLARHASQAISPSLKRLTKRKLEELGSVALYSVNGLGDTDAERAEG